MDFKIEDKLELLRDMQEFSHEADMLDDMVGGELNLDELDVVAAASANPAVSFSKFKKMLESR